MQNEYLVGAHSLDSVAGHIGGIGEVLVGLHVGGAKIYLIFHAVQYTIRIFAIEGTKLRDALETQDVGDVAGAAVGNDVLKVRLSGSAGEIVNKKAHGDRKHIAVFLAFQIRIEGEPGAYLSVEQLEDGRFGVVHVIVDDIEDCLGRGHVGKGNGVGRHQIHDLYGVEFLHIAFQGDHDTAPGVFCTAFEHCIITHTVVEQAVLFMLFYYKIDAVLFVGISTHSMEYGEERL